MTKRPARFSIRDSLLCSATENEIIDAVVKAGYGASIQNDSDFEGVKKALENRNEEFDLEQFKTLDENRRNLLSEVENLKAQQNKVSKQIPQMKRVKTERCFCTPRYFQRASFSRTDSPDD